MKIKLNLYDNESKDVIVVVDLLRASTTIITALNNFHTIIPVNTVEDAFKYKESAVLAGETQGKKIDNFDVSNSPIDILNFSNDTLIIKTTNGTKVLENVKTDNNTNILIGSSINAKAIAIKSLELASTEIELIMAGWHGKFTIEDFVGCGLIINEIIKIADEQNIDLELSELALVSKIISQDYQKAKQLIYDSGSAERLRKLKADKDIEECALLNKLNIVPMYENNKITNIY